MCVIDDGARTVYHASRKNRRWAVGWEHWNAKPVKSDLVLPEDVFGETRVFMEDSASEMLNIIHASEGVLRLDDCYVSSGLEAVVSFSGVLRIFPEETMASSVLNGVIGGCRIGIAEFATPEICGVTHFLIGRFFWREDSGAWFSAIIPDSKGLLRISAGNEQKLPRTRERRIADFAENVCKMRKA